MAVGRSPALGPRGSRTERADRTDKWGSRQSQLLSSLDLAGDLEEESESSSEEEEGGDELEGTGSSTSSGARLPPGWSAHYDGDTSCFYYYHAPTEQSTWKRPTEDDPDPPAPKAGEGKAGGDRTEGKRREWERLMGPGPTPGGTSRTPPEPRTRT